MDKMRPHYKCKRSSLKFKLYKYEQCSFREIVRSLTKNTIKWKRGLILSNAKVKIIEYWPNFFTSRKKMLQNSSLKIVWNGSGLMVTSEDWDVHWNGGCVRFVEADAEIALTAQKQNDEDTDVHQADACCNEFQCQTRLTQFSRTTWNYIGQPASHLGGRGLEPGRPVHRYFSGRSTGISVWNTKNNNKGTLNENLLLGAHGWGYHLVEIANFPKEDKQLLVVLNFFVRIG